MFTVKQNQLEAFRVPMRESERNKLIADLAAEDGNLYVSPDKKTIVQTDADGNNTTLTYSNEILPTAITKPSGVKYGMGYDKEGRLSEWEFPTGEQIQFNFDNGQIKTVSVSPEKSYLFDYQKGILVGVIYPGKKTQQFFYTESGHIRAIIDRTGQALEFIRKPDGQLEAVKDPLNRSVRFDYDENGLLSHLVFPDQTHQSYLYDEDEDILFVRLRDGKSFSQRYENETIKQLSWKDGPVIDFEYDTQGHPTRVQLEDTLVTFQYDDQNRLSAESGPFGTATLQYDSASRPILLTLPSGLLVTYQYDTDSRVTALTIGDQTTRFVYTDDLLAEIHYANNVSEYQQRNHTEGLRSVRVQNAHGRLISEQQYAYDNWARLSLYQDVASQQNYQLVYDDESRLTALIDTQTRQPKERFSYDAKGNLSVFNGYPLTVGYMDEIRQIGRANVHYDALGNVSRVNSRRGKLHFTFARNSTLTNVEVGSETWQYVYDGIGRRISKTNGTQWWRFSWVGSQLVGEEYLIRPGTSPTQREYIYLLDSQVPIAFREGGQLYWMQADVRGAITHIVGPQGQLVWHGSYSAFGEITIHTAQVRQPWRLTGMYEDDETGLYYSPARYYCPWLTTYISLATAWYNSETYYYAYARNDPYNRIDPFGTVARLINPKGIQSLINSTINGQQASSPEGDWYYPLGAMIRGTLSAVGLSIQSLLEDSDTLPGDSSGNRRNETIDSFLDALAN
ncbi:hypothetical protein GCM10028807_60660 [Spirosoma daeguense]